MTTNPNNIVRVRARINGHASVYEANAWCQTSSVGLLKGTGVTPNTIADMNVLVGGAPANPDVVIAETPSGYKIALDVVGRQALAITPPAENSRITSVVVYTDDLSLASTDEEDTGSPSSCGLIAVYGDAATTPEAPDDTAIRNAITEDGATGSQAAYCVLSSFTVSSTATALTGMANNVAKLAVPLGDGVVTAESFAVDAVDQSLDSDSTRPVSNQAVTEAIGTVEEILYKLNSGAGAGA